MQGKPAVRALSAAVQTAFDAVEVESPRRHLVRPAALLCAALSPMSAFADAPGVTTLPPVQVRGEALGGDYAPGAATVGAKTATPVRDIPQVITVVPQAVLSAQQANTLTDALRYVPGITLSAGEGGAIGDNINLRGQSARTDVFIDGFRDRGQYTRDTFYIDSVEVLKGPSSLFFGRGSTGGVINQVSKAPGLRPRNDVGVTVGTEDYYRATADFNRPLSDTSALRIAAVAHTNKSTRDVVESERYGVAPSLRFGIGTPTTFTISSMHLRSKEIPDLGVSTISSDPANPAGTKADPARPFHVDHDNFYGFTDDYFDQDVDAVTARIEHRFSPALTLRNQTQFNSARIDARATNFNRNTLERSLRRRDIDDSSLYNQTDLIGKFATGSVKHTVVAGVEVGRDDYNRTSFGPNNTGVFIGDIDHPVYAPLPAGVVQTPSSRVGTDAYTFAAYLNDTIALNEQWKVVGGLRHDRFRASQKTTDVATGVVTKLSSDDSMLSGRAGIVWQPTQAQSYYASYGTSFNPSAETITLSAANEKVDPEKNRSYEIGAKWDLFDADLSLTAALFRIEKTNARTTDPITDDVTVTGKTRTDGFELGFAGRILPNWQVFGGYTWLDGEVRKDADATLVGNTLLNTPKRNATLWTTWRFTPEWELGGGLVYTSERMLNNANTSVVSGYTRYDMTLAWHQKDYEVRLNVFNLTDKDYYDAAAANRAVPAQGRTALVSATYHF